MNRITSFLRSVFSRSATKARYNLATLHLSNWFRRLSFSWSRASFENLAKRAYANPYAARGLRLIAQNLASVPIMVRVGKNYPDRHPLSDLLERPNPRSSWYRFADQVVSHFYCGGELFVERRSPETGPNRGRPKRLYLWSPDQFEKFIYRGKNEPPGFLERLSPEAQRMTADGDIVGYWMRRKGGEGVAFTVEEMLHVPIYNPTDPERGLPILMGAHRALETMEAQDDWNRSIADGGGRIPGYWTPNGLPPGEQLTPEQVEAAEHNLDERTAARRKASLGMVLSGAFDWKDGTISPKDADWLESYRTNARAVGCVLGIDSSLLGDEKTGSLTDKGTDSARRSLYILTVLPLLDFFLTELTAWLGPLYGPDVALEYDRDGIDALQGDVAEEYRMLTLAAGGPFISRDEARVARRFAEKGGEFAEILTPFGLSAGSRSEPAPVRSIGPRALDRIAELIAEPEAA